MILSDQEQTKLVELAMKPFFAHVPLLDAYQALKDSGWIVEDAERLLFSRFTIQRCGSSYSAVRNSTPSA